MADYLTEDNGAVCSIPDGFNTAPYDRFYNIKGKANDVCEFPGEVLIAIFLKAISTPKDIVLCEPERGLVVSPGPVLVRPCYRLITE
jgi:hypothetical protein